MMCCLLLSICLNMIVKDEAPVIERCLKSVKPYVDYWVIVDTGSSDGTQQIIKSFMKDIPGELHEQPWVNFGHNRNGALDFAKGKGDYVLFIDADEVLQGSFDKNSLTHDFYFCKVLNSEAPLASCWRWFLINNHLDWRWKGIIHEYPKCAQEISHGFITDATVSALAKDGHRSQDPNKHLKDAAVLEKALVEEPNHPDYVFYLAQSYAQAGEFAKALPHYKRRAQMMGCEEHIFWSKYYIGYMQKLLKMDPETIERSYCDAYDYRPTRAEPILHLANDFVEQGNFVIGYALAQFGLSILYPKDLAFVEDWVYSYGMMGLLTNCALRMGRNREAEHLCEKVLEVKGIPDSIREQGLRTLEILRRQ